MYNVFMSLRQNSFAGYTLIELLIVVSIVVILAVGVLTSLNPLAQIFKGYDTRRKNDLAQLKIAYENYYSDHDCYPPASVLTQCGKDVLKPYLNSIPCDPNSGKPYTVHLIPANSTCPQQYAIYAPLISFFDKLGNSIAKCPNTYAVYSSNMLNVDIADGCSGIQSCAVLYGCKQGFCSVVGQDISKPTCSPTYCDSDCSGVDCKATRANGSFINECLNF